MTQAKTPRTLVDAGNGYCLEITKAQNYCLSLYAIRDGGLAPVYDSKSSNYWYAEVNDAKDVLHKLSEVMKMQPRKVVAPVKTETLVPCTDYIKSMAEKTICEQVRLCRGNLIRTARALDKLTS